jgi:hypothetical protein
VHISVRPHISGSSVTIRPLGAQQVAAYDVHTTLCEGLQTELENLNKQSV